MLLRNTVLLLLIVYKQVESSLLNGTNNSPNLSLDKKFTFNSQANGIRNRMSQLPQNQQNNFQQSETMNIAKNVQKALNLQASNIQNVNTQQSLNLQQAKLQPAAINNIQQPAILQQPVSLQQATNNVYPNNLQQNINLQAQKQNLGNMQIMRQVTDMPNGLFAQSYGGANPIMNCPVVTSQPNLYNANNPSDLVSLVLPQQQVSNNIVCPQNQQVSFGAKPSEVISGVCPQNQQLLYSSGTPYVTAMSQVANNIPSTIPSTTFQSISNQPSNPLSIMPVPQQNQQQYVVQNPVAMNPADLSNQITIIKSVQPYSSGPPDMNVNMVYSNGPGLPTPITEGGPYMNSLLAPVFSKQESKSSNFNTLLPLIIDLIREKNSCGCQNQCGCQNGFRMHDSGRDVIDGYSRQKMYGKQKIYADNNSKYADECPEDIDSENNIESERNSKKHEEPIKEKAISEEHDYSDEQEEEES